MIDSTYPIPKVALVLETVLAVLTEAVSRPLSAVAPKPQADRADDEAADIRQSQQGDSEAYRRLMNRHQEHVGRIMWRFSRKRSVHEELVQDVFVEAYFSLSTYRQRAPFEHWLARIATRVGYRYWKEKARRKEREPFSVEQWDDLATEEDVLDALEPEHAANLLHRLLERLPPRDRLVLTLRYFEECDVAETARRTGWTKTMVKVQTLRARNKLRALIEHSGTELIP